MKIVRQHHSTQIGAKQKLDREFDGLMKRFGDKASDINRQWKGDTLAFSLRTYGFDISGTLQVTSADLELDVKLPLIARAFEGRIESAVDQWVADTYGK